MYVVAAEYHCSASAVSVLRVLVGGDAVFQPLDRQHGLAVDLRVVRADLARGGRGPEPLQRGQPLGEGRGELLLLPELELAAESGVAGLRSARRWR